MNKPPFAREELNYDVFISYRHDTGFYMAELLYTKLTDNGYSVFMDKTMGSVKYEDKICAAIKNSRNFIIVLFPDDLAACKDEDSWLNKEASKALLSEGINIVPVMCDGFTWPKSQDALSETMNAVKKCNGVKVHKDYSLDSDLDNLFDKFLKNVSPANVKFTSTDFFKYNLETRKDVSVCGVDVAFHAGAPWLTPGEKKDMLIRSLKQKTPWRVLINTVEAAESIGQHMRDETALYIPFECVHDHWKKMASLFPDCLEVRECNIPLLHVHHAVRFTDTGNNQPHGELHVKYYAYNFTRTDSVFEHQVSSFSKYYAIYSDEFEFLWNQSQKI